MPVRMTETARTQNLKNSLIFGAALLAAYYGLTTVLSLASGRDRFDLDPVGIPVAWSLFVVVFAALWIYGRIVAGRVLLDCGPHPDKGGLLAAGVLLLVLTAWGLHSVPSLFAWDIAFPVSLTALFGVQAFGRLQVRENGIWNYWVLLRWGKIASYSWTDDCTLLVRKRGILSLPAALPVPPEQKQGVVEFLSSLCEVGHGM
jgi:hypothetical protein